MIAAVLRGVRFDEPRESEFRAHFEEQSRKSRAELWVILLTGIACVLVFHRFFLQLPPEVVPLGKTLLVGVLIPAVFRGLSVQGRPFDRWATELYIAAAFIDIGCILWLRVVSTHAGYDVVPLIIPVAVLLSLIVVQIRFLVLLPVVLVGLAGILGVELMAFELTTDRVFRLTAVSALVLVALAPAYDIERWMRRAWAHQRQLKDLAELDELTGLATRRSFETRFQQSIRAAMRSGKSVTLMIVDVDHFKAYNDHFGHPAGDRCLNLIGDYLKSATRRPQDFAARLGGEEFAVVWFDLKPDDVQTLAESLLQGMAGLGIVPPPNLGAAVTASGGIAYLSAPQRDLSITALRSVMIDSADKALYAAKRAGRDRVVVSDRTSDAIAGLARQARGAEKAPPLAEFDGSKPTLRESIVNVSRSLRFPEPLESQFRQDFEQQGRSARRLILVGLLAAFLGIIAGTASVLTREQFIIGTGCLLLGMTPPALIALAGTWLRRLLPWSAVLYIAAVWLILTTQMIERKYFLGDGSGYDLVPFLMPVSVLLSLSVVKIRFALLAPSMLAALAGVVAMELWAFEFTSYRFLDVATATLMTLVTLSFSYKLESYTRMGWKYQRRLDGIAHTDSLTNLPNRRMFDAAFVDVIRVAVREKRSVSLMIVDIDYFKPFNDHYGHPAGDECLRQIGIYLQSRMLRPLDFAARIGGEEFALVWFDAHFEAVSQLADEVRQGVSSLQISAAPDIGGYLTVSGGLAYAESAVTGERATDIAAEMIEKADIALYRAKNANRNQIAIFREKAPVTFPAN